MPQRNFKTIAIPLNTGTREYPLPTQAGMTGAKIVSLRTRRTGKTLLKQNLPSEAVFNAAMITLRDATNNTDSVDSLPLFFIDQIGQATGKGLDMTIGELDFASSKIIVQDEASIVAGTAIELTFEYIK